MSSNILGQFFQVFLYQPLFNALILIYNLLPGHDLGVAVIILTAVIKGLTWPLNTKAFRAQQAMAKVQPRIKEAQQKYKNNPGEQAKVVSEIFKKEKVSPFSSLVPILIQLPVLIALYQLFLKGLWAENNYLYSFVSRPGALSPTFLGIINLSQPSFLLAVLAGLAQLVQSLMMPNPAGQAGNSDPGQKMAQMMQKQMTFLFPILTVFILAKLPSVLGLYWLATSVFTILQQYILNKKHDFKGTTGNN
ncbi:MAG: YidC/Oxa1 family membrane protein insertase [bacterium]|nr:YidC/Oxa1 family membrane protein insertase [bacterium]